MTMTRSQALQYLAYAVDSALCERSIDDSNMPANTRLVVWLLPEPTTVAVWSCLMDTQGNVDRLDDVDAAEIAADILIEKGFFGEVYDEVPSADFVI